MALRGVTEGRRRGCGASRRARAALVAAMLGSAGLAGCTGDGAGLLAAGGNVPPGQTASVSATPGTPDEATRDQPQFNPFSDGSPTDRPLREVIEKPSRAEVMQAGALPEFSLGRDDAPVVLVKYMSLTCPYCRRFQFETFPALKREYIDTGKVRLVIREFPIGKASGTATIALRCAPMSKYLQLYEKFLARQSAWVAQEVRHDAIAKVAAEAGVTRAEYDACIADRKLVDDLKWVKDRGRQLGIIGTPNFFVEEKLVKKVVTTAELRQLLDAALAAKAATAGR